MDTTQIKWSLVSDPSCSQQGKVQPFLSSLCSELVLELLWVQSVIQMYIHQPSSKDVSCYHIQGCGDVGMRKYL